MHSFLEHYSFPPHNYDTSIALLLPENGVCFPEHILKEATLKAGANISWRTELCMTGTIVVWLTQNTPSTFAGKHTAVSFQEYIENKLFEEACLGKKIEKKRIKANLLETLHCISSV